VLLPACTTSNRQTAGHPFRFGVLGERIRSCDGLLAQARRAEALSYATLLLRDHFVPEPFGDQLAPMVALAAAAGATRTLQVGTLVLDNDWRHPVLLAKEAATLDLLSGGRFELGIGAGWLGEDDRRAGMPFDAPGVRVGRFEESLRVLKGLLAARVHVCGRALLGHGPGGLPAAGPGGRRQQADARDRSSTARSAINTSSWAPSRGGRSQARTPGCRLAGDAGVQQRGRRHHQHPAGVLVAGWVQERAEVAVRHPAGLQNLAVGVGAELCHWPAPAPGRWLGGTRLPGPQGR
jgi:alkanesulfonate monooxygenase SsuD/methylene tetrahydromethanopterin reductase-like flavin-dependent oxidoreductase (luciferase family)